MDQIQQTVLNDNKPPDEKFENDVAADTEPGVQRLKPPNKKKFDDELESFLASIRFKETQLKNEQDFSTQTGCPNLREIRTERDSMIEKRKTIDTGLNSLNQQVAEQMGALTRLKATLHYKSEDRVNDAIRRLEYQLNSQNFKLSEEKKIVAEIDSLKRSKKVVSQYLAMNSEIEEMRSRQRLMREERDVSFLSYQGLPQQINRFQPALSSASSSLHYFRAMGQLKTKELESKRTSITERANRERLKQEINELYESKRQLVGEFKKMEKAFNTARDQKKRLRIESFRRREIEKKEAMQKEMEEYKVSQGPYNTEITVCNKLIHYLHSFTSDLDSTITQTLSSPGAASLTTRGMSVDRIAEPEGMHALQRKCSVDSAIGVNRKVRRSSKHRKSILSKPLTHSPEVFEQFASLVLTAPSNMIEMGASLEQLNARKSFYVSQDPVNDASTATTDDGSQSTRLTATCGQSNESTASDRVGFTTSSNVERQTSKTESIGSATESQTCDSVVDMLTDAKAENRASTLSPTECDENSCPECDMGDSRASKALSFHKKLGQSEDRALIHSQSSPCLLNADEGSRVASRCGDERLLARVTGTVEDRTCVACAVKVAATSDKNDRESMEAAERDVCCRCCCCCIDDDDDDDDGVHDDDRGLGCGVIHDGLVSRCVKCGGRLKPTRDKQHPGKTGHGDVCTRSLVGGTDDACRGTGDSAVERTPVMVNERVGGEHNDRTSREASNEKIQSKNHAERSVSGGGGEEEETTGRTDDTNSPGVQDAMVAQITASLPNVAVVEKLLTIDENA